MLTRTVESGAAFNTGTSPSTFFKSAAMDMGTSRWRRGRKWRLCGEASAELQQSRGGSAKNRDLFFSGQARGLQHRIDRCGARDRKAEVRTDDDLAGSGGGDEIPNVLRAVDERVEVQLRTSQILTRLFLGLLASGLQGVTVVRAADVRGQKSAAMRGDDFQAREPIEEPLENHVRE